MSNFEKIVKGEYQHYKGNIYNVVGIGKDTETEKDVVIYQPLYDSDIAYWVRPLSMFRDTVVVDGKTLPRFKKVGDDQ